MNILKSTDNTYIKKTYGVKKIISYKEIREHVIINKALYGLAFTFLFGITLFFALAQTKYECKQKTIDGDRYCKQRKTSPPPIGTWSGWVLGQCTTANPPCSGS